MVFNFESPVRGIPYSDDLFVKYSEGYYSMPRKIGKIYYGKSYPSIKIK